VTTLKTREMTLRVTADEAAPGRSRSYLLELKPFLEPRFDDVALVLSELVTNSVKHGTRDGEIRVRVTATGDSIRLEVGDGGRGFDAAESRGDGMGLNIIDMVADAWGVRRAGQFIVWVEMKRTI
jgi:two-component sensor histidine kinase